MENPTHKSKTPVKDELMKQDKHKRLEAKWSGIIFLLASKQDRQALERCFIIFKSTCCFSRATNWLGSGFYFQSPVSAWFRIELTHGTNILMSALTH